jgi:GNAT superfamily N-acetyltransferase
MISGYRAQAGQPGTTGGMLCQSCAMSDPGIVVHPVGEGNFEASVQFLIGWVSDGAARARAYLADHAEPAGASLIAVHGDDVAGYAAIVWESNFDGFRDRGIPLVHQLVVAGPFRRQGVATLLIDAAEQLACERGITTLGITVGLFDEYGPAQRLYGQRGYVPDGRGVCRAQRPLGKGVQVTMDDGLIMWLTKDLARLRPAPHAIRPCCRMPLPRRDWSGGSSFMRGYGDSH